MGSAGQVAQIWPITLLIPNPNSLPMANEVLACEFFVIINVKFQVINLNSQRSFLRILFFFNLGQKKHSKFVFFQSFFGPKF